MLLTRRSALQMTGAAIAGLGTIGRVSAQTEQFGFETVVSKARALSKRPYERPQEELPETLSGLSYDRYRRIHYRRDRTLLRGDGSVFGLQLFHRGGIFRKRVLVNLVTRGQVTPLAYSTGLFDFGAKGPPAGLPSDLGFAGLRILFPLNRPGKLDELVSFLGASYFRFLGKRQHYGLSARALSLGSGQPNEEFPDFIEFWVESPDARARQIRVHALLDSPSITGAYRFEFTPGGSDDVAVQASLFPRRNLDDIGIAPLTSMYFFGENAIKKPMDFRPEVHDSDGLAILTGRGEWIWRPLVNPPHIRTSVFLDKDMQGFGLIQRDRRFRSYQDLEALYHQRPGYWVRMKTPTGAGRVKLVELHTTSETDDNIVACWIPDTLPVVGQQFDISYALRAVTAPLHAGGRAVSTFETHVGAATSNSDPGRRRFLIDFAGGRLGNARLPINDIEVVASASSGTIGAPTVIRNRAIDGVRVSFDVELPTDRDVDLRVFLRLRLDTLTETWCYRHNALV